MTYWRLFYHLVWATKSRLPVIDAQREAVLMRSLPGIARQNGAMVHGMGVMPEHVHVVVSIPPKASVSAVVNRLKGSSSHLLGHDEAQGTGTAWTGWQQGYGALSFAEKDLKSVVRYVTHQRERHASDRLSEMLEHWGDAQNPTDDDADSQSSE